MRTASGPDLALVAGNFAAHLRVDVYGPDAAWHNMTNFLSYDWVVSAEWGESIDQAIPDAVIEFIAKQSTISLNPHISLSPANLLNIVYDPLLEFNRPIRIYDSLTAIGVSPTVWNLRFEGEIDAITPGEGTVKVTARIMGQVADQWIDTIREYGSTAGVAMETVIQSLLNDNMTSPPTLYTPVSPGFVISPAYPQEEGLLLEQAKNLAMLKGWDLRPKWDNGTGAWRLTLIDPNRAGGTPVATIDPDEYLAVTDYTGSLSNIRNICRVKYYEATNETEDPDEVWSSDAASIAAYGEKFIGVVAAPTIDSAAEAQALADVIIADLSLPLFSKAVEHTYWPWVEIRDYISWGANAVHYDLDQNMAVVTYRHSFSKDGRARTKFSVRGKPVGAYGSWLRGRGVNQDPEAVGSLQIYDVEEIAPSDVSQKTIQWKIGALVENVEVHWLAVDAVLTGGADPWNNLGAAKAQINRLSAQQYTFPMPTPGRFMFCQLTPQGIDPSITGSPVRLILVPFGSRLDEFVTFDVAINQADGSVVVRAEYPYPGVGSWRYAYDVGAAPVWVTDAAVEAGTYRDVLSGVDTLTFGAGTVGLGETFRIRAAAYAAPLGVGGSGLATDHGTIRAVEASRTVFRPATIRTTTFDESTETHGVTVTDPDSVATDLHYRIKEGNNPPGPWTLSASPPSDGVEYQATVNMVEGHISFAEWRITGSLEGTTYYAYLTSPGFDFGTIPNPVIIPRIYEDTSSAGAAVGGDGDMAGVKILCRIDRNPTLAELQAAITINGRNIDAATIGNLVTGLNLGDPLFYGALGVGHDGSLTPAPVYVSAIFGTLPPVLKITTELETTDIGGQEVGRFGVTLLDPAGQADLLEYQLWLGNDLVLDWTTKANPPASGVEYVEDIVLEDGSGLGWVKYRLTYDRYGVTYQIFATSRGFDYGNLPTITILPTLYQTTGDLTATVLADADTRYTWIYWELITGGFVEPSPAFIKANAQFSGTNKIFTPADLGTITTLYGNDVVAIRALGHTAIDGVSGVDGPITPVDVEYGAGPSGETGNYIKVSSIAMVPGASADKLYPQIVAEVGPETSHVAYWWTDPVTGNPDPGVLEDEDATGGARVITITIPSGYAVGDYPCVANFTPWDRVSTPNKSGLSKTINFDGTAVGPEGVFRYKTAAGVVATSDYLKAVTGKGVDFVLDTDGRPYPKVMTGDFITIDTVDPVTPPADQTIPHIWVKKL